MRCAITEYTYLFFGLALIWVGDFDDMKRLIKIGGGLLPFSSVEGEDRIDCHIRDRGSMSVPRIQTCSRDNVRLAWRFARCRQWGNGQQDSCHREVFRAMPGWGLTRLGPP